MECCLPDLFLQWGRLHTENNPCGWPVTSVFDIKYISAEILRCPHNEVKISQRWSLIHDGNYSLPFASDTSSISFQHRTIKKRWSDLAITPSTEYWNCKGDFWFLKFNVGCTTYMLCILVECWALNFQECVIMLNVESLSWIINLECRNGKLKVGCYNLILAAQVDFSSFPWPLV